MDILKTIMGERMAAVADARKLVPEKVLIEQAESRKHHGLKEKINCCAEPCIIAEVKKASPSAGLIRKDYRPADIALGFQKAGAVGISVLTEPLHFLGSEKDFMDVRKAVDISVLRKDFLCDVYQVYESAAWGADVILLIIAALKRPQLVKLYETAGKMGLEVLVEAHTGEEVKTALELDNAIVGVNSRNLKTLQTDLSVLKKLASLIPADRLSIAESSIKTKLEINELRALGYKGFLVGEALMKCTDPAAKLQELRA
ncbi:MAG: indole-3-glycerol phosphate synthase TrpC [Kiritimatiellae bacterium]|nr:indole-3-glycerol phosphate synthase TrpC [Kiritimatiellia bacterium]MDD5520430.1 indole-3-glycerol phosphate synthase TrpC [Kiritimatiellia bacterium]